MNEAVESVRWKDNRLEIIDQTRLPEEVIYSDLKTTKEVWHAIKRLAVRGAPAIGITAAYGLVIGLREDRPESREAVLKSAETQADYLKSSRPTAVNLAWALDRLLKTLRNAESEDPETLVNLALQEARTIHQQDREICRSIGQVGAELFTTPASVITHCNTGGLATGQYGTAFSVIYHAHQAGNISQVWADETRPLLQGARLTTWELMRAGIPFRLITDSMAPLVMQQQKADMVIVGTDRVAANGDTANKIGTYGLAVSARHHGIPFYVAAPVSSIDFSISSGDQIPIEEREPDEICRIGEHRIAPPDCPAWNPAFDVTPAELITGFITERGVVYPPFEANLSGLQEQAHVPF